MSQPMKAIFLTALLLAVGSAQSAEKPAQDEKVEVSFYGATFICPLASATYFRTAAVLHLRLKDERPQDFDPGTGMDETTTCRLKPGSIAPEPSARALSN